MGLTFRLGQIPLGVFTDASNNVGIGAAPSGTYKFEVTGTSKISGIATFGSTLSNGTYTYTLPSATGTLALTSDLSGYVTLSTAQTITGAKTFTANNLFTTYPNRFEQGVGIKETAGYGSTSGYTTISGATSGLSLYLSGGGISTLAFPSVFANFTYTFPSATGTIALTSNLSAYLPLAGGTLSGLLDISTASYLTSRLKLTNTATGGNIWSVSSGNANNSINNSLFTIINETLSKNTFVLSPTGKLAIGENLGSINPADALSVYDTNTILRVFDLTGNGSSVVLQATNTASYVNAAYNTTAIPLILRTANTTRLTIAATGEATFTGAIIGTTSTFTNAGSGIGVGITNSSTGDGLKITHSAGRALQIVSSATGFGILINNDTASTSVPFTIQKSGSPVITMTDAGGLTLAGALTGTSATFSDTVAITLTASDSRIKGGDATGRLLLANSGTTTYGIFYGASHATYPNTISLVTDNTERLKITNTGAATFSSSVTAANYIGEAATTELRLKGGGYGASYNTSLRSITGAIGVLQFGNNNDNYILAGNTAAGGYLIFKVNCTSESTASGIEAMRISSAGNVGIGNTGATDQRLSLSGVDNTSSNYALVVKNSSLSTLLYVRNDGQCYISGLTWVYGSDKRLKENINYIETGLEKILALKPAKFDYIDGAKDNIGWIAQDIEKVIPEAISINTINDKGYLGLKSDFIVPYLVKAIQEQQKQIEELKLKIK